MYDGYYSIAGIYDKLNADIDYERWSDFIAACFDRFLPENPDIVLDLACGTGRMTFPLADRGFDMIGIDGSADMLAEAYNKSYDRTEAAEAQGKTAPRPLFLQQDMRAFELYGTVDATVCCLDSMNYLTGDGDLDQCLSCIHLYLAPGGLLIFDVNSPYKFEHVYGNNAYILEDEGIFCGWQNDYDPQTRLCRFDLSVFEEAEDGKYTRTDETQTERCYTEDELRSALDRAGFDLYGIFADFDFSAPSATTERWHIVARTRKTGDWYLSK